MKKPVHWLRYWLDRRKRSSEVTTQDIVLHSSVGYPISCTVYASQNAQHSLLLCPPHGQGRVFFQREDSPFQARKLASYGYRVLVFDPAGRGNSWGEEDFGGVEHQDNAYQCIQFLLQETPIVFVLGVGTGLSTALGAISKHNGVQMCIDIDGLSDRELIVEQHAPHYPKLDEYFWKYREPIRQITKISCPYIRMQWTSDSRNATRLLRACQQRVPFQFQNHPWNVYPSPFPAPPKNRFEMEANLHKILAWLKTSDGWNPTLNSEHPP